MVDIVDKVLVNGLLVVVEGLVVEVVIEELVAGVDVETAAVVVEITQL